MVIVSCSVPDCNFTTDDVSEALAIALLANHGLAHSAPQQSGPVNASRGPKLERPKVDVGISTEDWHMFLRRWEVFKTGSGINDASASLQLFQCAGVTLGDSLLKSDPNAASRPLADLLKAMRDLAVIPVAIGVLRTELLQLHQERDEQFRAFAARVRGKADTCDFHTSCSCGESVDYTDNVIKDVLLCGMYDPDIRREVLGVHNILKMTVNEVTALVENKEMARNALPSSVMSGISTFKRQSQKSSVLPPRPSTPYTEDQTRQATCPDCKQLYRLFSEGARGWNKKPHKVCINCYRVRRRERRIPGSTPPFTQSIHAVETNPVSQITSLQADKQQPTHNTIVLDHHIFTAGEWKRTRLRAHPMIPIRISIDKSPRKPLAKWHNAHAEVSAIADTGAQSDLWSLADFLAQGFSRTDLYPVSLGLSAANRSPISIEGAFFAKIEATPQQGDVSECRSMVYVSSSVQGMYLSYDTLLNLGVLRSIFPSVGQAGVNSPSVNVIREIHDGCDTPGNETCSCPQRTVTPPRPKDLPFTCTPENNDKMKKWLLERYSSSTFNTCPHRMLPCMEGPPVEIHLEPSALPKACHTPADITLHWQQKVYDDLVRDEALGVVERVPYGEPVTWCHRMVVTRKHDGSPRRTVDLSPLNKFCKRETFASESPFHLARRIPQNTWKTVTDAWNGYHSVPLRESDRHLTTFITPFGRWRYIRAPQGFLSSGDGYNRRFDAILSEFHRKERCVDDTVHYDTDLEQHWWRTIDILTRIGQAGIVLNPDKFQFAQKAVDFAGFRISDSTIEPLPKYINAIRDFPTPTCTTDIRSWFGLVNQVSNYAQLRDIMSPFKPFLSPRCKFSWSDELERAFTASKQAIIDAICRGVEIFDINKPTCLRPDWSTRGIGYFLLQKTCNCVSKLPDCCPGGWLVTLAGSRSLSPTEQRYAAIEGEALAVAWGLEQTRFFTQGCSNLIVVTDHKPLVKIFGDRTLDEIANSRLFRMKQRTLPWHFEICHLPGISNKAADATSRHPSPSNSTTCAMFFQSAPDLVESAFMSAIQQDVEGLNVLTYDKIAQETARDTSMSRLLQILQNGHYTWAQDDVGLAQFWPLRNALYVQDGVILYEDRVVIPPSLRQQALQHLHAAHQGTSTMEHRARQVVYWPGMTKDINEIRRNCNACNRNAPSQPATPPICSTPPSTPFEEIFADFFDYGGRHYLVIGDRLSGWVEVLSANTASDLSGSSGLIQHLRAFFATFGVPNELSSDGGPEFVAGRTQEFLRRWGVQHRVSSAYFPQSNGRAEVAVKTAKRLLLTNTTSTGGLDHDRFLRAILQLRNTPDPDCNVSPAEIIFGHPLRDAFSFVSRLEKYSNPHVRPLWRQAWAAKEDALRTRMTRTTEALRANTRPLRSLAAGDYVFIQNQLGLNPGKWDRSGIVVESLGHDQYLVKVDGSGRLTRRNRRFLRAYTPASSGRGHHPGTKHLGVLPLPVPPYSDLIENPKHNDSGPSVDQDAAVPDLNPLPMPSKDSAQAEYPTAIEPVTQDAVEPNPMPTVSGHPSPLRTDVTSAPSPSTSIWTTGSRPRRTTRPPKVYEPESGCWVHRKLT